ncbi:MAG TPA: hypothetical protein PLD62_10975 [Candidatus Cloacimonadota bacterium]|nr:hypothetical protein [Candidatus Cloacimonadota bacterium]
MKKINLIWIFLLLLISCAVNKVEYFPIWWQTETEGVVTGYGTGANDLENIAKLAAQNDAYNQFTKVIIKYLNDYVATNCIEPGDEQIQRELDRIFLSFTKHFQSLTTPKITIGNSEATSIKIDGKIHLKYFVSLQIQQSEIRADFVDFLDTSDLYISPKLRSVLRNCFKQ